MLEVKNISKTYITGSLKQVALNDVTLSFRDNEFVSILGPSGSGKTTLLNIIGGLDQYDKGDLIINGISTKKYKSRDWDSYRNHTVGFVFQSYNLIPHQTILSNVELALTISGVSKKERRKRALKALEEVGLKKQEHKKPNQMSGGQMQRVAVARALVNNPDILLADEPTGALDSETSLQVMDLLKKIAKDRLVIMVTHNPELASQYSNRIIKLKDGKIIDDSNPVKIEQKQPIHSYKNLGKSSMSFLTAFGLSLNNLLTKKGRTILTSFAGSIGIIGIALILSLSNGFQNYIDDVQEDMLTSYPLTIEKETADATGILLSAVSNEENKNGEGVDVSETKNIEKMFSSVGKNDMKYFKHYIEERNSKMQEMTSYISYGYEITPNIYTRDVTNKITRINPSSVMNTLTGGLSTSGMGYNMGVFAELTGSNEMIEDDYTIIKGRFPKQYDEVVIFLPDENHISDLLLYTLGLKDTSKLNEMINSIMDGKKVTDDGNILTYTYDDLLNLELKLIENSNLYQYNERYNIYEDMSNDANYIENLYNQAMTLKIVGIVKPKEQGGMSSLMSGVGYTRDLTQYVINQASQKEIVKKQLQNKNINVFSGKSFDDTNSNSGINFEELITIDTNMLSSAFNVQIDENAIKDMTANYMEEISNAITTDTTAAKDKYLNTLKDISKGLMNDYIDKNHMEGMDSVAIITQEEVEQTVNDYFATDTTQSKLKALEEEYTIPATVYQEIYQTFIKQVLTGYVTAMSGTGTGAILSKDATDTMVDTAVDNDELSAVADQFAHQMVEATMQKTILGKVGELTGKLMETMANAFQVDQNKIAGAFQFNLTEDDIKRIFSAMSNTTITDANSNLLQLGYQDLEDPSTISFYFKDFASKEEFISFLKNYNKIKEKEDKEKVIEYTDITGIMISSVKVIVDSVSYVLIAFVSISLIVSSIMIGIITYISVLERTKEIGILRAIGASKKNISSIFNAETVIVGFLSGFMGVIISVLLLVPINSIIHSLTKNPNITAILPVAAMIILIILSTILTLIGGIIPSRKAAKQDPVLALRSE